MSQHVIKRIELFPLDIPAVAGGKYGASKVLLAGRSATLVRITTNTGLKGWGECSGPPSILLAHLQTLAPLLLDQPVAPPENLWQRHINRMYHWASTGLHIAAVSGYDIAIWDLLSQVTGLSLSALLGGQERESIRAYASTGYYHETDEMEALAGYMHEVHDKNFPATKIKIGSGKVIDRERVQLAREIVGPDVGIMVDYNANGTAATTSESIREIAEFGIDWVEEPISHRVPAAWGSIEALGIPLATGEAMYTRAEFQRFVDTRVVDVLQPNLSVCGGFTEAKAISTIAGASGLRVVPHCWGTGILIAATLHFLAALPEAPFGQQVGIDPMLELDMSENPLRWGVLKEPLVTTNGDMQVPQGLGLGVQVDTAALAQWMTIEQPIVIEA